MSRSKYIESSKFRYRLLTPKERYKLLDKKIELKEQYGEVEGDINSLRLKRNRILAEIRKLTRMIDTGKERVGSVKKKKVKKK